MSLAASEKEWGRLQRTQAGLTLAGVATCLVQQRDLPIPFDRLYCGGLYYPGNAELDPASFVRALAATLRDGTQIFEKTSVSSLTESSSSWLISIAGHRVKAESVIVATNAYTPRLLPSIPIVPRRGQVLATSALNRVVCPFPMYANEGYQYWRQTPEGRLIVGGWRNLALDSEIGEEEILHEQIHRRLDVFAQNIIGEQINTEYRWCGIMGFTPDMLPLAGRVASHGNLYIAAGYSGHGVAMAFKCGEDVGKMALGEHVSFPDGFNPARFAPSNEPLGLTPEGGEG
jgi:gamma-glutamylputrescine oxidase